MKRVHELLLYLYPGAFRAEYADEMRRIVADGSRQASGVLGTLAFWLDVVTDALTSAAGAHWDLLRQDLGYMRRSLTRSPGFVVTAIAVAALGIGVTTTVYTLTDQVLLRPLPYAASERLVKIWEAVPQYSQMELSPANFRDLKSRSRSFETFAAYYFNPVNLVGEGEPVRVRGVAVTGQFFATLGIEPLLGRVLDGEDDRESAEPAAVLGYRLWQSLFGGEPVLGRTVRLDGTPYEVIGVMPQDFYFPARDSDLWTMARFGPDDFEDRNNNYLYGLARLEAGHTFEEARSELALIAARLEKEYPETNEDVSVTMIRLRDDVPRDARLMLWGLAGASVCVLLIACTNLASLLLARGLERDKELAVRTAMGAGRERLLRQLLTENLALAGLGGLIGLVSANAVVPHLVRLVPATLPVGEPSAADARAVLFAVLVTCVTGVGFGVLPAMRGRRGMELSGLREGVRTGIGGRRQRLRSLLVAVQVMATVVLLTTSGLLMRALVRVSSQDPGFRTEDVLAVQTPVAWTAYQETARRAELYRRILTETRAVPGVSHAAFTSFLPMEVGGGIWPVKIPGREETSGPGRQGPWTASLRFVTPGFFATMGIRLRAGRDFDERDTGTARYVAVVSESFVERFWPDKDPLGKRFEFGFAEREVAGVVGDIRVRGLERPSEPQVYLPYLQVPDGGLIGYVPKELVLRAAASRERLIAEVRRIIRRADAELPVGKVRTLAEVVGEQTTPRRVQVGLLGAFTALSLTLSGIGLYGLLAFSVSQRRGELGLRIALGAPVSGIVAMVMRQAAVLTATGATAGITLGYAAARGLESLLFGVRPGDATTYFIAGGIVAILALAACALPALRAARVDPTEALRAE
ncbi:MAG TPA: ABC transporter permease [Vicinamibacteria bacterium]|nr:ABC transporter permease [Vicinamibacteria bacterium]